MKSKYIFHSSKRNEYLSEINVTPLVDVMLILVVMFLLIPSSPQKSILINTPNTILNQTQNTNDGVNIYISRDGTYSIDNVRLDAAKLKDFLTTLKSKHKKSVINIHADKGVKYDSVAFAINMAKASNFSNVALIMTGEVAPLP